MIQRIQSVYLLLAIALISAMSYLTLADLVTSDTSIYTFNLRGFFHETSQGSERMLTSWSLFAMAQIINVLLLITIFLFRHRVLQMRLCIYNMVLSLGLFGMIFFVVKHVSGVTATAFHVPVLFPLLVFVLVLLAFRAIRKDHILTQFDRIR